MFMKVFVTGSSGYLGKPLVEAIRNKYDLVEYDIVKGQDILDYEQLKKSMKGCYVVVHLAAIPGPVEGRSFDDYFLINCIGTHNVVKAAVENKVKRLVYASSTTYYGVERGIPFKSPIKEDQKIIPMYLKADDLSCRDCDLAYSESKIIAENILAFYGLTKKIEIIILRFSAIGKTFLETSVSLENAVQGIIKSVETKKVLWYEVFNVVDNIKKVDNSKAKRILGYKPKSAKYN